MVRLAVALALLLLAACADVENPLLPTDEPQAARSVTRGVTEYTHGEHTIRVIARGGKEAHILHFQKGELKSKAKIKDKGKGTLISYGGKADRIFNFEDGQGASPTRIPLSSDYQPDPSLGLYDVDSCKRTQCADENRAMWIAAGWYFAALTAVGAACATEVAVPGPQCAAAMAALAMAHTEFVFALFAYDDCVEQCESMLIPGLFRGSMGSSFPESPWRKERVLG